MMKMVCVLLFWSVSLGLWAAEGEPDTVSISVIRVLADGSQWLVADGLEDGQECIDPLPPIGVAFSYLVTAFAATGASSSITVPARVGADVAAFNFGAAASSCVVARIEPSWQQSVSRTVKLYHFADGGANGGLPTAYEGADVDATRRQDFTLLDAPAVRELQSLAAAHATCWYRDPYGGRCLCSASWSFTAGYPMRAWEASASMTETVFEEAW